jgi:hypothetical protein
MPWPYDARDPWIMDEKGRARWDHTRKTGRRQFILVRGVLLWGLGGALLDAALQWIWLSPSFQPWPNFLGNATVFGLIGYFWGRWRWNDRELQYLSGEGTAAPTVHANR